MNNEKKSNKLKIVTLILMILLVLTGTSYAIITWSYEGKTDNLLSTPDISFRFLESNKEVIGIENGVPMTDEQGMNQTGTGNVFDFEVKSKFNANTDVKYTVSLEKLTIDSGKTQIPEDEIKIYVEDFEGKTVLKPTKISDLDNYNLFIKTDRHSKDNEEISSKYRLKVWLDESVDVFTNQNRQYKFKINVGTTEQEQNPNQTYNLVYNLNGGTGNISSTSFKVGNKVTITSTVPTKDGYKFLGWSTNKNNSNAEYTSGEQVSLTNAYNNTVTLYAIWQSNAYTVKYDSNSGTGTMTDSSFKYGESKKLTKNTFTKEGYTFLGWNTDKTKQEALYIDEQVVSNLIKSGNSVTLYAIWKANTYTVKYDNNGGNGSIENTTFTYGESKKLTKNTFTKTGYTFLGWNTDKEATTVLYTDEKQVSNLTKENNEIITLYAIWKANTYTVKYDNNGGVGTISNSTFTYNQTKSLTKNTFTKEGYKFLGWNTDKYSTKALYTDEQQVSNLTIKNNDTITLYAIWEEITYTVKYNANGGAIKDVQSIEPDVNYDPLNIGIVENKVNWIKEGDVYKSRDFTETEGSMLLSNPITVEKASKLTLDIVVSQNEDASVNVGITSADFSETKESKIVYGTPGLTDESNLPYQTVEFSLEPGSYALVFEAVAGSASEGLNKAYVKNIKITSSSDKTMEDSIFKGSNKLSKNLYQRDHYIFKGWSLEQNATSATYQDEQQVSGLATKENDTVNLYAIWEKEKYTVNVVVQNGTVDTASKEVLYNENATFNLTSNSEGAIGIVTCTNNQTGQIENNILTVSNVSASTTCTVNFKDTYTTLYEDGTLIINESIKNRNTNISTHGNITKEYEPMSDSNSYVMSSFETRPWYSENDSIKSVEIGQKIEPISMKYWFFELTNMEKGDFTNLDTSKVMDMNSMFSGAGQNATTWNIGDLSGWNTSNVTDMGSMFNRAGQNATIFELDLSTWDVSNVTDMSSMFDRTGEKATTWNIGDISNWNTSNVADMGYMFTSAGQNATTWNIGALSGWNTSKVMNMRYMFDRTGEKATTWNIGDISNWDTSNVADMHYMFTSAGQNATTFDIGDLSKWNTSSVTDMSSMFSYTGKNSTTFKLDLSKWDTSKVITTSGMFNNAGANSTTWSIGDISGWNTSNITNMSSMFTYAGYNVTTFEFDLSSWDVSKVTNMREMFSYAGKNATTWTIGDLKTWDTSNVTNMSNMFNSTGGKSTYFNLELSNWDTSKVTSMSGMFGASGQSATTWNVGDLSSWNTSNVTEMSYMFQMAGASDKTWSIGDISNWDTSKVIDMSYMFYHSGSVMSSFELDLSAWDTSSVTNMSGMFSMTANYAKTWTVKIPSKTGSLTNTTSKWYGSSSSVYAEPLSGKSFTLA